MLSDFENFVNRNTLFSKKDRLLLAISGGADSVCLFHLLRLNGYKLELAHCNFGLRGKESDADEEFVRDLAEKSGIKAHFIRFDTKKEMETSGCGIQETARKLRYDWFGQLQNIHHFDRILTAHHQTDNSETMLINLLRSTGVPGLHGIPLRNGSVVRPLMFCGRSAIDAFMAENGFACRHDASNDSDDYLRNRVRHRIMPVLNELTEDIDGVLDSVARKVSEYERLTEDLLAGLQKTHISSREEGYFISDGIFEGIREADSLLYQILRHRGFSRSALKACADPIHMQTGKKVESEQWVLLRERAGFFLSPVRAESQKSCSIEQAPGDYQSGNCVVNLAVIAPEETEFGRLNTLYFDLDLCRFPLLLRTWQEADKMQPLGMNGSKKISDILTDRKTPHAYRREQMVLTDSQGLILALLPAVGSELCKVDKACRRVLRLIVKSL